MRTIDAIYFTRSKVDCTGHERASSLTHGDRSWQTCVFTPVAHHSDIDAFDTPLM